MKARGETDNQRDAETGLLNRRGLTRCAREMLRVASAKHGVISCLVVRLQVDAGKVGAIAKLCAVALQAKTRVGDVLARLGETDFAVLAPNTDSHGARLLAERLAGGVREAFGVVPGHERLRVAVGYEVTYNLSQDSIGTNALLLRAATAAPSGGAAAGERWLRRYGDGVELLDSRALNQAEA